MEKVIVLGIVFIPALFVFMERIAGHKDAASGEEPEAELPAAGLPANGLSESSAE